MAGTSEPKSGRASPQTVQAKARVPVRVEWDFNLAGMVSLAPGWAVPRRVTVTAGNLEVVIVTPQPEGRPVVERVCITDPQGVTTTTLRRVNPRELVVDGLMAVLHKAEKAGSGYAITPVVEPDAEIRDVVRHAVGWAP
jgi:hypothetical protein